MVTTKSLNTVTYGLALVLAGLDRHFTNELAWGMVAGGAPALFFGLAFTNGRGDDLSQAP